LVKLASRNFETLPKIKKVACPYFKKNVIICNMTKVPYILLLNSTLKEYFLTLNAQEKRRLREKFEFLENGIWDAGVRVKKLRGVSNRIVFEARLTRDERIIFTLGKQGDKTAIYAWGITKHDDLNGAASSAVKRHILPTNTPFLQFEPAEEEVFPEVIIDELPAEYYSQEQIEEKSPEGYGPQKWHVLSDEEWKRLLLSSREDNFEIFLFLTREQQSVLEMDPPILLSGTAGSGKTTISVYYLLRRELLDKRRVFITYSPFLKRFSESIYQGLTRHTIIEEGSVRPDFYVFRDLLADMLSAAGKKLDPEKEVGLREFERIFSGHGLFKKYDTELVWEEIRSIIKGSKPPLSVARYRKLSSEWLSGEIATTGRSELIDYLLVLRNLEFFPKIEKLVENKAGYSSYDEFIANVALGRSRAKGEAPFVVQEIGRVLEKKQKSFASPLLSFWEYQVLGKKRAPNFIYDRRDIYSIAEYYQGKLEEEGLWDEIDLTRKALETMAMGDGKTHKEHPEEGKKPEGSYINLKTEYCGTERWKGQDKKSEYINLHKSNSKHLNIQNGRFLYDFVVCDEVQDFADVQISLIFRLARSAERVLLAGDPKQIINPSGFRWEEVKAKFYERGVAVPEVVSLNLNFRCVGNIVRLANTLLDLKQRLVGITGSELHEEWKFSGKPPILVQGVEEKEIIEKIRLTGAGQVVITRDSEEGKRLKKTLGTELVFTIQEAKGLEFDTVLLWKFSSNPKASTIWRRIKNEHSFDREHYPHIRHEINLLYVAVTRARNTLILYDGPEPSHVWSVDALSEMLYKTNQSDDLLKVWRHVSSPSEWDEQGEYFFEREYYRAAVECFKNAGNKEKEEKARAFVLEIDEKYAEASPLFEKYGIIEKAAPGYERAGDYEKALPLWEQLGDKNRAGLCRIRIWETQGDYDRAAEEWEMRGDLESALKNWEKAQNHRRIAEHYLRKKRYQEAAARFEKAGMINEACRCYSKVKMYNRAAALFFQAGDFESAAILYRKLNQNESLIKCYQKLGNHYATATIYEKSKDLLKAVEYFKKFADVSEENTIKLRDEAERFEKGKRTLKAAVRFSALGLHERSAAIYLKKGYPELALKEFEKSGDLGGKAECYKSMGEYYREACEIEQSSLPNREERAFEAFRRYIYSARLHGKRVPEYYYLGGMIDKKRAEELFLEAERLMAEESYEKALTRYKAIRYVDGIYDAYSKLDRHEEALRYFMENDLLNEAEGYLDEKKCIEMSPALLESIIQNTIKEFRWYDKEEKRRLELILRLIEMCLQRHRDQQILSTIGDFIYHISKSYHFDFKKDYPAHFLRLCLELRLYNPLFRVLSWVYLGPNKPLSRKVKNFLSLVREEAEKAGDKNLLAINLYFMDRDGFEELLSTLSPGDENHELFTKSRRHYIKVVEYYRAKGNIERAAMVCRSQDDFYLAGELYEGEGDFRSAARHYRDAGAYERALTCFARIEDEVGIARVYERMGKYDKALEIWKKISKKSEILRLEKKMKKDAAKKNQLRLF